MVARRRVYAGEATLGLAVLCLTAVHGLSGGWFGAAAGWGPAFVASGVPGAGLGRRAACSAPRVRRGSGLGRGPLMTATEPGSASLAGAVDTGGDAVCFDGACPTGMEQSLEMLELDLKELSETERRLRREGALMLLNKIQQEPGVRETLVGGGVQQPGGGGGAPAGQSIIARKLAGRSGPTVWSEFGALAAQTKGVNLGQGFPNWSPPEFVTAAAVQVLSQSSAAQQYTRTAGHPPLCALLAARYSMHLGRTISPDTEVAVTVGASQALFLSLQTLVEAGDEVLLLEPFFDLYVGQINLAGGVPTYCPLLPNGSGGWELDTDLLRSKITPRTKVLVLNSPHNPTGKVFTAAEMERIADVVREYPQLTVVSDEVYKYVVHSDTPSGGGERLGSEGHVHFARLDGMWDRTLTVSSAGKTFSVTGWQVGWIVGPAKLVRDVQTMLPFVQFCASTPMQESLVAVLKKADQPYQGERSYYDWLKKGYVSKREKLAAALRGAGIEPMQSQGGFFLIGDTSRLQVPDKYMQETTPAMPRMTRDWALCRWLALEYGVVSIPCSPFYSLENRHLGENYVRFAFCKTDETLDEAAAALAKVPH